jgi:hypothetical protein
LKKFSVFVLAILAVSGYSQYKVYVLPAPTNFISTRISDGNIIGGSSSGGGACLWESPEFKFRVLTPPGFKSSSVYGIYQKQQVGSGVRSERKMALLWSGTAESAISLDRPDLYSYTEAGGTDGATQVGWGGVGEYMHAVLWRGTAESVVDLHPDGWLYSNAVGVWGDVQIGNAELAPVKWHGTPESMEFLDPDPKAGFATAIHRGEIVGYYYSTYINSAVLWKRGKAILLGPANFTSEAFDTNGEYQVGVGHRPDGDGADRPHALLWHGSRVSMIDLHQFLPSRFSISVAYGIDESGRIVGTAVDLNAGTEFPILWIPTSRPSIR